ncbi:hypothetical protein QFZ89_006771 [Paraburkholderia youngii]
MDLARQAARRIRSGGEPRVVDRVAEVDAHARTSLLLPSPDASSLWDWSSRIPGGRAPARSPYSVAFFNLEQLRPLIGQLTPVGQTSNRKNVQPHPSLFSEIFLRSGLPPVRKPSHCNPRECRA